MTPAEVAAKLRAFNEWRRGDEDIPQPDPRVIGEAIDAAVEMIDRLEAAESEAIEQARLNGMGSEREAALLSKLEAAEKDIIIKEEAIDSLAAVVKRLNAQCDAAEKEREMDEERIADLMADLNRVGHEIDALRAKITEMEKQAPIGTAHAMPGAGAFTVACFAAQDIPVGAKLYALPGAKGE